LAEERRSSQGRRGVDNTSVRREYLCVALAALDEPRPVVARERRVRLAHERGQVLRAQLELTVER